MGLLSPSRRDLRETYLPAFRATVVEGKAASVMCANNRVNGQPCCENTRLLADILRGECGFQGYVVSDCGAVGDIFANHKVTPALEAAAARAVKGGHRVRIVDSQDFSPFGVKRLEWFRAHVTQAQAPISLLGNKAL